MVKFRIACIVSCLVSAAPSALAAAPVAQHMSCDQAVGTARAARIVSHCIQVSQATHPPCSAGFECQDLLDYTDQACRALGADPPAFCGESPNLNKLSGRALIERYARTVLADQAAALKAREELRQARAKLEPLASKRTSATAALKAGQADFAKELKLAVAAYDKYKAAAKKPGAVGLEGTRQALSAQFGSAVQHGKSLANDAAALSALDTQILGFSASASSATIELAAFDAKEAKSLIDALTDKLFKVTPSNAATANDAARAKAISAETAAISKALQALAIEGKREAQALTSLIGNNLAGSNARTQIGKAAQKTEQARAQAQRALDEIGQQSKASASRRRADAPSAKQSNCDLQRVDFKNYDLPSPYGASEAAERFRNGRSTDPGFADPNGLAPEIGDIQFFDLDGNGKKEAIITVNRPVTSPHGGPDNELHFMELDEQCRIQQIAAFRGGVTAGEFKGKSYFYYEVVLDTPPGQSGLFPVGNDRVELRYVNGELVETSRKSGPL
ncbi:MAG: hypothetical protein WDO74_29275 [Pseudomonadota bacterium]